MEKAVCSPTAKGLLQGAGRAGRSPLQTTDIYSSKGKDGHYLVGHHFNSNPCMRCTQDTPVENLIGYQTGLSNQSSFFPRQTSVRSFPPKPQRTRQDLAPSYHQHQNHYHLSWLAVFRVCLFFLNSTSTCIQFRLDSKKNDMKSRS